ncbi:hypothetical protein GCM10010123_09250 [Pilimelia anulata]|uniref:Lipoprotein n=1 Tax=Pilimelia anulata TaxID=53371 RepID=A0A8J3B3X4_9ACTN|nr:hypothetical protein [Pilimelia anulata]GGJ81611.1 hypothetical protein GCM10010123_09250 [Pilimelia anulata]
MIKKTCALGVLLILTLGAVTACGLFGKQDRTEPDDALDNSGGYGFKISKDAGFTFTNGLTVLKVRKGPLTIKKVEPVIVGSTLRMLGVKVRHIPPEAQGAVFQTNPGWPSVRRKDETPRGAWQTLADPGAFQVPAPDPAKTDSSSPVVQVLVGYEITGNGRGVMRGMHVTFSYEGDTRRVFVGSYLAVCSPSTVKCQQEDQDGPVAETN